MELAWLLQVALPIVGYATSSMLGHGGRRGWSREEVKKNFPDTYKLMRDHEKECRNCWAFDIRGKNIVCIYCQEIVAKRGVKE